MPQFGVCTGPENAAVLQVAGWDYIEAHTQHLLEGEKPDSQWTPPALPLALPIPAANCLFPASLKVTGPDASLSRLESYITTILRRAARVGIDTLVFGSGNVRQAPAGFDRVKARGQLCDFARMAAPLAQVRGITIVLEPQNKKECNLVNSIGDAMRCVRAVDHPNFLCLLDSWHFWLENDSLDSLREALPWIHHVHLADHQGRLAPGQTASPEPASDYRPLLGLLKHAGYGRRISVEATFTPDLASTCGTVLAFLKHQWAAA